MLLDIWNRDESKVFVDINRNKTKGEIRRKKNIYKKTRRKNHDNKKDRAVYRAYEDGNGVRRSSG